MPFRILLLLLLLLLMMRRMDDWAWEDSVVELVSLRLDLWRGRRER